MKREIMRSFVPSDMQDIPEVTGSDHAHLCPIVLESDIGRDRGSMNNQVDLIGFNTCLFTKFRSAFEHTFGLVVRCAGNLVEIDTMIGFDNQIRIRSADIDTDSSHSALPGSSRLKK